MTDDSFVLFELFDSTFRTSERVTLARANPIDDYDEKKFRERFRLSKTVVHRFPEEVMHVTTRHNTTDRDHVKWVGSGD